MRLEELRAVASVVGEHAVGDLDVPVVVVVEEGPGAMLEAHRFHGWILDNKGVSSIRLLIDGAPVDDDFEQAVKQLPSKARPKKRRSKKPKPKKRKPRKA